MDLGLIRIHEIRDERDDRVEAVESEVKELASWCPHVDRSIDYLRTEVKRLSKHWDRALVDLSLPRPASCLHRSWSPRAHLPDQRPTGPVSTIMNRLHGRGTMGRSRPLYQTRPMVRAFIPTSVQFLYRLITIPPPPISHPPPNTYPPPKSAHHTHTPYPTVHPPPSHFDPTYHPAQFSSTPQPSDATNFLTSPDNDLVSSIPANSLGHLPKMQFPQFDGDNPKLWLSRAKSHFEMYSIHPSVWVCVATHHMTHAAARWLQSVESSLSNISWEAFSSLIHERFSHDQHELLIR